MLQESLFGSLWRRATGGRRARALIVLGTASHAGKSWTATALCRYLRRQGLKVAPFKARNISLNSAVCRDGAEIGRAQAVQAEACGLEPRGDFNPVLFKPNVSNGLQAVVNGKVWRNLTPAEVPSHTGELLSQAQAAFERLTSEFEFVVIEGSGGAAEINLRASDFANLPLAARLKVPALLVADIDRGGAFASVVGTFALLEDADNKIIKSFLINRFRGDIQCFDEGRRMLVERAGKPCLGVFPHERSIRIDAEDQLSLDSYRPAPVAPSELRIAIVRLPHVSNFTDFKLLPQAEYIEEPTRYDPDLIVLPGTKNTLEDLAWMKKSGLDRWILDRRKEGAAIWGVCGGYQMLGRFVSDPHEVESPRGKLPGLGLLPAQTTLAKEKTTRQVTARLAGSGEEFQAYEIHMGETQPAAGETPFCEIGGRPEGHWRRGLVGTCLHGALEDPRVLQALLDDAAVWRNKAAPKTPPDTTRDEHYERLADWFERHADLKLFEELYLP